MTTTIRATELRRIKLADDDRAPHSPAGRVRSFPQPVSGFVPLI